VSFARFSSRFNGNNANQSDGWFMGMVPNLVTGVWVGNEDRSARFQSITTRGAAPPVWAYFMKLCYADENLKCRKESLNRKSSIRVDCYNAPAAKDTTATLQNTDEFEF
jgi:penicillin-binding protein 1A